MATKISWYDVIDITSYVLKYPTDWFYKSGYDYKARETSVYENIGRYSTEEKAITCLHKFAESKGIDFEQNSFKCDYAPYYEEEYATECTPILEVGIWFNIYDKQVKNNSDDRNYGTGAMIVKKSIILDAD